MKYDTIIIGSGLAGLVAGSTLSKFGKKVLVLEQHHKPGGYATTFKRNDFVIEVGLHEMSGFSPGNTVQKVFQMLEIDKHVNFIQVPELYAMYAKGEKRVFPHGFEKATNTLIKRYPEDEKGIRRFMKLISGIQKETLKLPRSPWRRKLVYPFMPLLYPNIVEATRHTVGSWLDKYIKNEDLKLELAAHVVYYADDPYTLSMFYFGLPQSSFIRGGGHFIQGGSQKLSDYLVSYIEKNGGTVLLGKKVQKIVTKNGKVVSVAFSDSFNKDKTLNNIECDNAVANCAIPLVPDMLVKPFDNLLRNKMEGKTISCSLLCLYLGFNTDLKAFGVKHYSNYIQGDDVNTLKDVHPNQRKDWTKRSFIFVDYGQINAKLAPAGKSVGAICTVDYLEDWENLNAEAYTAKKKEVTEHLLQRLDAQFPGIRDRIEYAEIATPKTMKRYTLNTGGTPYGFTQSKEQSGFKRFRNNFLIPNLYFASAWAFPGGGFEGTIMTGFLAALQMLKDNIWESKTAEKYADDRIVKLVSLQEIDKNRLELRFHKPAKFEHKKGQYIILRLLDPEATELDLPYRWLPIESTAEDPDLLVKIALENNSFSKNCKQLEIGDEALILGPMAS
ncbi:phytoene desaturase family protein [Flavobacteriaceae bacterium M23B6Z8]